MNKKKNRLVTPSLAASAPIELFPDNPVSGADIFATPRCFKDGSSSQPVLMLEDDSYEDDGECSKALSDLTNTQLVRKRPAKRQRRVFRAAKTEGAVTGEEGFESGSENLEMSPNLLD